MSLASPRTMSQKLYELVFSLYSHPHFGILAEPYLVQLLENGSLSLTFQKVGEANVEAFFPEVSQHQIRLISILRRLSNQHLAKELKVLPVNLEDQIRKLSEAKDKKNIQLFEVLKGKLSTAKEEFFKAIDGTERIFEAGKDGYPAFRELNFRPEVLLRMRYNFSETGIQVDPIFNDSVLNGSALQIFDESTAYAIAGSTLIPIPAGLKPSRLRPFGLKKSIEVQSSFSAEYAKKIVLPDLQAGLAILEGNAISEHIPLASAELNFSFNFEGEQLGLFEKKKAVNSDSLPS